MSQPKVLFFDIETAPNRAWVWSKYVDGSVIDFISEWYILCFSYKWMGDEDVTVVAQPDFRNYKRNKECDKNVTKALWKLLDEADVLVAHNGDRFDIRKANARFAVHGLGPTSPVSSIDTLKVARRHFMFNSNRLGDLGEHLGLGVKEQTGGFKTWTGCIDGDPESWALMTNYAKQDTALLEQVYLELRPWITNHPSMNMLSGNAFACPLCGTEDSLMKRGFKDTKVSRFQVYHCKSCKGWPRERLSNKRATRPMFVAG